MADVIFHLDDKAWDEEFNSIGGPVGRLIAELSEQAAITARRVVHVLPGTPRSGYWTARSSAVRPAGYTKSSIHTHGPVRGSRTGKLYGGVNAAADPGIFLEHPAEQMIPHSGGRGYPFLTVGLAELEL